jgi:protein-glutamine gamma-glutamyltransferase
MRFQAAHKLVTYLLVLSALAALGTTRGLAPGSALAFLIVCACSFGVDAGSPRLAAALDRAAGGVRAATGLLLVAIVWRIWRRIPDADLAPAFDLVLVLLGYKLLYRRNHRDYVHIYALSFILVLVASTITATFLFMAAFAVYVVLATWALILFHLRREMEENYLVRHSAQAPSQKVGIGRILGSRRVVGRAFFAATFVVAAAVFVGALCVFAFVPRLGAGFVLGAHAQPNLVGLSDEVALGQYGTEASARHAVVLRATLPRLRALGSEITRQDAAERLYFRGAVYDTYEAGRWLRSRRPELRTVVDEAGGRAFIHELGESATPDSLAGAERQELEAVGVPAAVLFAVDRPVAIELPSTRLGAGGTVGVVPRWSGEAALRVGGDGQSGFGDGFVTLAHAHYVAYSRPRALGTPALETRARLDNLALPDGLQGLKKLAARLGASGETDTGKTDGEKTDGEKTDGEKTDGEKTDGEKIAAVIEWLRSGHSYTTRPPARPAGVDPVADFLFTQPSGHCEFFASAAVLLLRAAGVPARYVTGFRGGEWNPIGGYVAVRGERAHAWAEAFVAGAGWTRVDATPPAEALAPPGRLDATSDALDFFWSRWVVGYDLGRQRDLANQAWHGLGRVGARAPLMRMLIGLLLTAALGGLGFAVRRRGWRRARGGGTARRAGLEAPRTAGAVDRLYRRTLARLARLGWPRRPNETPHEYAARLRVAGPFAGDGTFDGLTARYAAARFGGQEPADEAVAALGRTIGELLSGGRVLSGSPQN